MFKKLFIPLGIVLAGTFVWRKIMLIKKLDFFIQRVKFNFSFISQSIALTIGINNKTQEAGVVQDLNGNLYFVDLDQKEIFIGTLKLSPNKVINILPYKTSFAEFIIDLKGIRTLQSIVSLVTNKQGSVRFIGKVKALGITQSVQTTYKLK